jgi:hypothetical protein
MAEVSRLDQELADALGVTQAVRFAAGQVRALGTDVPAKLAARLTALDAELADLQERLNALVVADPAKRARLTGRSRRLRDLEDRRLDGDADVLDALQALAADAAHAAAQWRVVRQLAKATGDKGLRRLAKDALTTAEGHLELALDACTRVAKARAGALVAAA